MRDAIGAIRKEKQARARERWSREHVLDWQRERVAALARHAAERSPYYSGRLGGATRLGELPTIDKATFVERFDEIVTDPRLRRDALLAHVEAVDGDDLYLGRYRVMATSGSTGLKGLFVYDRADWQAVCAGFLRMTRFTGLTPRIPRRRLAFVGPPRGMHMSRRMSATMSTPLQRTLQIPATLPLDELVARLHGYRPTALGGFATIVALLAREQLAGRLSIAPEQVVCTSELLTGTMRETIRAAWGVDPFDVYGITEAGMLGCDCAEHRGIHVNADLMAVEVVDADHRPVPDGEVGSAMLITSLDNRVQPTIRLAVSDRVAYDPEPCPCGSPLPLLRAVEGRTDDVIALRGTGGRQVPVHPLQFAAVARAPEVREFQVVQAGDHVRVRVVLQAGAELPVRLEGELERRLAELGVVAPSVRLEAVDGLPRDGSGKLKLVVAEGVAAAIA